MSFRNLIKLPWLCQLKRISIKSQRSYHILSQIQHKTLVSSIKPVPFYKMSTLSTVTYDQLPKIGRTENQYLIDVRERDEIRESGAIPGAINIPLSEIQAALTDLPSEQFQKKYGVAKPTHLSYLVFSCRSGKRSDMAGQLAIKLGYKDVAHFPGGYLDYENQTKSQQAVTGASKS